MESHEKNNLISLLNLFFMNIPSDAFEPLTHVVNLTDSTIKSNTRFFTDEEDVPKSAITKSAEDYYENIRC